MNAAMQKETMDQQFAWTHKTNMYGWKLTSIRRIDFENNALEIL